MATSGKLNAIRDAIGAGARANKYKIFLGERVPDGDLLGKSASFPGVTIGKIEVWNQGRKLTIPGDTDYEGSWAISFYNTEDHALRKAFLAWMREIDNFQDNIHAGNPGSKMVEMKVIQMNADGTEGQTYIMHNCFPAEIGEITVADETADSIQEFDVTFSFTDWVIA
jgi:hypothetical protein